MEGLRLTLHLTLAGVELGAQRLDILKDLGVHLAGDVLQDDVEIFGAAAMRADILPGAQKEAPAFRVLSEFGDAWKSHYSMEPPVFRPGVGNSRKPNEPRFSH